MADDPVKIFYSDDAYVLQCQPMYSEDGEEPVLVIFGIAVSAASMLPEMTHVEQRQGLR